MRATAAQMKNNAIAKEYLISDEHGKVYSY